MTDFSSIASYYDLMTGYQGRLISDFGVIKHIVDKFQIKSALDAGCGTGVHTIILSKIGMDVIGLDASQEMLDIARANALREGVEPPFEREYFESMPLSWSDRFDAVFCLANSLVGVETGERLTLALKSFHRVLKPGGRAIIQVLNFIRFRRQDRRIIKISSADNLTFVRFFDFEERETRLNILVIEHDMGQIEHKFHSQKILPVNEEVLLVASKMARFSDVKLYGDLSLTEGSSLEADNIVAVMTK